MKTIVTASLVFAIGIGTLVAASSAGQRSNANSNVPDRTITAVGQSVPYYGFDSILKAGVPAKISFNDNSGILWCFTVTNTGPGQWSCSGTAITGPQCPCDPWIASGTITQTGATFSVFFEAVNCASDGCTICVDCIHYNGTWTRASGNGGWTNYCNLSCTSTLFNGSWNATITPPAC